MCARGACACARAAPARRRVVRARGDAVRRHHLRHLRHGAQLRRRQPPARWQNPGQVRALPTKLRARPAQRARARAYALTRRVLVATRRAGWTAMHTTAMYLPDTLTDAEQKSFVDLVHSTLLYPGNVSRTAFRGSRGSRADEIAARTRRHAHVRGASLPRSTAGCGAATLWCPWRGGMEEAAGAASFGTLNTIWNFWHNPQTRTRTHSTQTHKHMYAHACM